MDDLASRYGGRTDVAVVTVRIEDVEPISIRSGLLGIVRSEHLTATVLEVRAVGKGFDNDVPRRMLRQGLLVDLINKPGSDRARGISGLAKGVEGGGDDAGVPLGNLARGRSACVVLGRPGRNGFLILAATTLDHP